MIWRFSLRGNTPSPEIAFGALMTAGLAAVLASAYLFFRIFEAPFMRSGEGRRRIAVAMPSA
jgi:peptidoglycan/LPS O-acetylase OafA/YrhL